MKPPNYRELKYDSQDLDQVRSIDNCTKCPYCIRRDSDNKHICRKYNYEVNVRYLDGRRFSICDSYPEIMAHYEKQKKITYDERKRIERNRQKFEKRVAYGCAWFIVCIIISGLISDLYLLEALLSPIAYSLFFAGILIFFIVKKVWMKESGKKMNAKVVKREAKFVKIPKKEFLELTKNLDDENFED